MGMQNWQGFCLGKINLLPKIMNQIFELLFSAAKAAPHAIDRSNRQDMAILGAVSNNDDPDGLRRIKITDPASPGLESHWLRRIAPAPGYDLPMPEIGQTVRVLFVEGDPSQGWYSSCINLTNPPLIKKDPIRDAAFSYPGERVTTIAQSDLLKVSKNIKLENGVGAFIEMTAEGNVIIGDAFGKKITMANGLLTIDLNGARYLRSMTLSSCLSNPQ